MGKWPTGRDGRAGWVWWRGRGRGWSTNMLVPRSREHKPGRGVHSCGGQQPPELPQEEPQAPTLRPGGSGAQLGPGKAGAVRGAEPITRPEAAARPRGPVTQEEPQAPPSRVQCLGSGGRGPA